MGSFSSSTRLSRLSVKVILTQTDTTVGFLSQDEKKLQDIKSRQSSKPFIKVYKNFKTLLASQHRIPSKFKNRVRRSKKTTFIVKNRAFRVHESSLDSQVLKKYFWHYSTSANESSKNFDRDFCMQKADIIVENKDGLRELSSSSLYKINHSRRKRIR
ncbi:hypothetical protein [Sulfurimonas sp.]|uniref:hypothetical protein n=1 Tax=Sulfurimonas sp. TaxID=2022749 RepID=UPI003566BC1B